MKTSDSSLEGVIITRGLVTEEELKALNDWENIPLYLTLSGNSAENPTTLCDAINLHHVLVPRWLDNNTPFTVNSTLYEKVALPILNRFCRYHNIEYSEVLRCAINVTFPSSSEEYLVDPHVDHLTPHHFLLIYLNDSDGSTVVFNDTREVHGFTTADTLDVHVEVHPERGKIMGVEDGTRLHTAKACTSGYRAVLVITFR
jgi:hypothetical protein